MATWTTFLAQVRREMEEAVAGTYADESFLEWTNDAVAKIADKTGDLVDEQDTETVASQQSYALPVHTTAPTIVFCGGKRIERESMNDWWIASDIDATGTPTHYTATRDAIYLRPIPDAVLPLRYFRTYRPTPFAAISDTTDMPFDGRYNALIRSYVKARALEQAGDPAEAQMYSQQFEAGLADAVYEARRERGADRNPLPAEAW